MAASVGNAKVAVTKLKIQQQPRPKRYVKVRFPPQSEEKTTLFFCHVNN